MKKITASIAKFFRKLFGDNATKDYQEILQRELYKISPYTVTHICRNNDEGMVQYLIDNNIPFFYKGNKIRFNIAKLKERFKTSDDNLSIKLYSYKGHRFYHTDIDIGALNKSLKSMHDY